MLLFLLRRFFQAELDVVLSLVRSRRSGPQRSDRSPGTRWHRVGQLLGALRENRIVPPKLLESPLAFGRGEP